MSKDFFKEKAINITNQTLNRIRNKILITSSTFFLFLPVLIAFVFNFYYNGIYSSIFKSTFDVSYFNIVSPFLLVSMTFNHNKLLVNIVQTKKLS